MQLKLNNKLIIVFISLFASGIFTVVFMGSHHSRENMEVLIESSAHSQVKANVQYSLLTQNSKPSQTN